MEERPLHQAQPGRDRRAQRLSFSFGQDADPGPARRQGALDRLSRCAGQRLRGLNGVRPPLRPALYFVDRSGAIRDQHFEPSYAIGVGWLSEDGVFSDVEEVVDLPAALTPVKVDDNGKAITQLGRGALSGT